ncbi:MAG: FAD-dependent oxidoreductase [Candidatus Leucobacter sulfamidivorax]|nr:FAD-dependent oxidoreductase [Candidatus Leucobacter sulfamidivorax]
MKVAVVGLGSTGSMALWRLSSAPGVTAVGFEQFGIGHPHGGYSGGSRLFRTAYHEGGRYVPLLARSRRLWAALERASGRRLFDDFGVLTVAQEEDEAFIRLIESIKEYRLPHRRYNSAALRARYPQFDVVDGEVGVLDQSGGALRPGLGVLSAIELAVRNGATVREHEAIEGIEQGEDGIRVASASGTRTFDRVIVTAGSWAESLVPELAGLTEVRRIVTTRFAPRVAAQYAPGALPCFIRDRDGLHVFGSPAVDGCSVGISWDATGPIAADRPELMDRRIDADELSEFGAEVQSLLTGLWPEPVGYGVHHDSYTADKTPIVDSRGGIVVVAGLSGHGFKLAPALGELASRLAVHGATPLWDPGFSITGHAPVHAPASPSAQRPSSASSTSSVMSSV